MEVAGSNPALPRHHESTTDFLKTAQFKRLADIVQALGLAAVIGGLGDAAVNGIRLNLDTYSVVVGFALLIYSVVLSGRDRAG